MPKMQVNCPNCHQPIVADVQQLFDVSVDPSAKQRLLSGAYNLVRCQYCGYQGNLSTVIVYHDPEKELLLTYLPPEIGLPRNEQEKLIGNLINQAISNLPQEKRKGYLFNPQSTLTMQGLIERVLEADGITREMIQAQQQKLSLLQRLAGITDKDSLAETIKQEDALIDNEFFVLMNRLGEAALASGDRDSATRLAELQRSLLELSTYGKEVKAQSAEIETAMKDLQAAGKDLTREKMLEMLLNAPNEIRFGALVSLARPALDYSFFQLLSERIDRARPDGRQRLVELRTRLLEMTREIDQRLEEHRQQTHQLIEAILESKNLEEAIAQSMPAVDDIFLQEVQEMQKDAREKGDLDRSAKLQNILEIIQKASSPPPELALVEQFLDAKDDDERQSFLNAHKDQITQEFLDLLANFALQVQSQNEKQLSERVVAAHRAATRFSMQRKFQA